MDTLDAPDTLALVRSAQSGDAAAWSTLVDRYEKYLLRLSRHALDVRIQSRIGPEDVVQETLLEAFRKLDRFFESSLPFSVWLRLGLLDHVRRLRRDHVATQKRSMRSEADPVSGWERLVMDPGTSPSGRASRAEDQRLLRGMFEELPQDDREVIVLYHLERRPYEEIASLLGLTVPAVRKRLSRAVTRVALLLRRTYPEWCHAFESLIQRRP